MLLRVLMLSVVFLFLIQLADAQKTYYVSSSIGNDANDGLSESTAWKTLDKISTANIMPGVHILFKAGDTFVGQLKPGYSGTFYEPIVFGKYGAGNNPVLDGATTNGAYTATILINNQEYIELQDLEITNDSPVCLPGEDEKASYGIWVLNDTTVKEVMHHFQFKRLTIRDIFAQNTLGIGFNDLTVAGIYFKTEKNYVAGQEKNIQDVLVDSCYITRTGKFGIWSQHKGSADASIGNDSINRNMNLVFINNHTYETGGSGLTPGKSYNVLVENNIFEKSGSGIDPRMANRGSGAWFYNCRNVLAQYNKSLHARGEGDSYGMHIDHSNKNVFLQYNYSEDASGGFVEILGNNVNSVYRYNISVNDGLREGARTLWVTQYPSNLPKSDLNYIYGNTIYVKAGLTPDIKIEGKNTYVFNNSFHVAGNGEIGEVVEINTSVDGELIVDNNLFFGNISSAFKNLDTNPVNGDPKYYMPGVLDENAYKLSEGSAALNAGRLIIEPVFPKAGQGIFANTSVTFNKDYYGNPIDLANQTPHIGAYNGTPLNNTSINYNAAYAKNSFTVELYPNPTSSILNIEITTKYDGQADMKLMDITGKIIINRHASIFRGQNMLQYNIGDIVEEGIYFISIEINEKPYMKRILIQK